MRKKYIYLVLTILSLFIFVCNSLTADSVTLLNGNKIEGNIFEVKVGEYVRIQLGNRNEITIHWDEMKEYTDEVYVQKDDRETVKIKDIVGQYKWKFKAWKSPVTIEIKLESGKIIFSGQNPQGKVMSGSGFLNGNQVTMYDWILGSGDEALKGTHKIVFSRDAKTFFSFVKYEKEPEIEYAYQGIKVSKQPAEQK